MPAHKRNGSWYISAWVKLPNGQRVRLRQKSPVNTKVDALEYERKLIRATLEGREEKPDPLFKAYADEFMDKWAAGKNKPTTLTMKRAYLDNHLVPTFGKLRLSEITTREIDFFVAEKGKVVAPGTVRMMLAVLRKMLKVAKDWGYIESIPNIERPKLVDKEVNFLTFEEADKLVAAAVEPWKTLILVALRTGLRIGELSAVQWCDVNLDNEVVRVCRNIPTGVGRAKAKVGTPKGGKARNVDLAWDACEALKTYPRTNERVFPCLGSHKNDTRHLQQECKRAGVRAITWHTLRHTCASHLVQRGASLVAVKELLGHATIMQTSVYAHLAPGDKKAAVNLLAPKRPHLDTDPKEESPK